MSSPSKHGRGPAGGTGYIYRGGGKGAGGQVEDLVVQVEGGDIKTRELTGHKVVRYAQTDHICVPAELTY